MRSDEQKITSTEDAQTPAPKRKWGVGRILCVTLLALLSLIILAVASVIIWLGPIVEEFVETHAKELTGRNITMDNLSIKLFEGSLGVDNLVMYEADDVAEFVRFGRVEAEIELMELLDNTIHISRFWVREPEVAVVQSPETFNFDSLVEYLLTTYVSDEVEESTGEPWNIVIENISLEEGKVAYCDTELEQEWRLSALALSTPRLYLDDAMTTVAAAMTINEAGTLNGDLNVNCSTLDFLFDGAIAGFNIADTYNYIKPVVNLQSLDGAISADCRLEGNVMEILAMEITGDISASNLVVLGPDGGNLFSAKSLAASLDRLNVEQQVYHLRSLTADGYSTQFRLEKDGTTNFDLLFYGEPEISVETTAEALGDDMYDVKERVTITTSEDEAPFADFDLVIGNLNLRGGEVLYADNTMHEPFEYQIRGLSISSKNLTLDDKNKLTIRCQLPKQGTAMIMWEGSLDDFYNQSLLATLSNVDIQSLSTYVEHFTAFPVTSGNLTFRSQNEVSNGKLSGVNQLGTYNFNVGDKDKSIEAEYKLPVKLGIYVLTDREKHIDVELPISGDITSPEFSLRKVIWQAIGNVLLKVVASPFEWMSKDKQDAFRSFDIDLLAQGLDSEHYARIDTMVNTLKQDTTLAVRLKPRVNYKRAVREFADMRLKMAYYNATEGKESGFVDMLDFARINEMKLSGSEIRDFADSLLIESGINPANMTTHAKAVALYGDKIDGQLLAVINMRNQTIARYVAFQHKDLPAEKFTVVPVTIEDIKNYSGKDIYSVSLVVGEEEVEVKSDEEEAAEGPTEESAEEPTEEVAEEPTDGATEIKNEE